MTLTGLERKTAVVTGGASGIGRAISGMLAAQGARVVVLDKSDDLGGKSDDLGRGPGIESRQVDLTRLDDAYAALDAVPVIDLLVNAAGIMLQGDILTVAPDDWDRVFAINLKVPFFLTQRAATRMPPSGSIVNICSIGGVSAVTTSAAIYHASKGALITLTKSWARALAPRAIRVNGVLPGLTDTPMLAGIFRRDAQASGASPEEVRQAAAGGIPLARIARPEEIASVACFLLSPRSSYVTGTCVNVSGGVVM